MASNRGIVHDTDAVLFFAATQDARLHVMRQANAQAAALVQQAMADEDPGRRIRVVVGIDHEDITTKQRGFFHAAVLPQISEQARVGGLQYTADCWKEFVRKQFLPDRWETMRLPGQKKATPRRIRSSTEDLSIKGYSEHIDKVIAYAVTELGVEFHFIASERDAVRWKRKRIEKAPARPEPVEAWAQDAH